MPSQLALLLTLGFIFFLYRRDIRQASNVTGALWLPLIWMLISGSRPVTYWLNLWGIPVGGAVSLEEGSPIDRIFYIGMIASGIYVLNQRGVKLAEIFRNNVWMSIFLGYCFLSILWS